MTHRIDLYDLSNGFTNQKIIATFKDKFYYQKELYSSFYNQLYTILSSIDDDICKELIDQMNQTVQIDQTDQTTEHEEKRMCLESDTSDGYEIFDFM